MIYSTGDCNLYSKVIQKSHEAGEIAIKRGRREGFPGGFAFRSYEDAVRFLEEANDTQSCVLTVDADWENDTIPSAIGWWRYLLRDVKIIA